MLSQWNESSFMDLIVTASNAVKEKLATVETFPQWIDTHPSEGYLIAAAAGVSIFLFMLHRSDIPPAWYVKLKTSLRRMGTMRRTQQLHYAKLLSMAADILTEGLDAKLEKNEINKHDVDWLIKKLGNHVPLRDLLPMRNTPEFIKSAIRYRLNRAEMKRGKKTVPLYNGPAPIPGEASKPPMVDGLAKVKAILARNTASK